jgi:hypothetical protein
VGHGVYPPDSCAEASCGEIQHGDRHTAQCPSVIVPYVAATRTLWKGNPMRKLAVVLVAMLCASCALLPFEIQKAPLKPDQAVVFDIDGTLTPSPLAIYTAREDAAKAARIFADAGYKIIYLSARTQLFQSGIPNWLKKSNFPEGSINVPQTDKDSSDHAAFKKRVLYAYKTNRWTFIAAYGDSSTDFDAYAEVGIPEDRVFALRREGKSSCEPGKWKTCLSGWTEHISFITNLVSPEKQ